MQTISSLNGVGSTGLEEIRESEGAKETVKSSHRNWSGTVPTYISHQTEEQEYLSERKNHLLICSGGEGRGGRCTSEYIVEVRLVVDWLVFTRFNTQSVREYRQAEIDTHEWRTICILTMDLETTLQYWYWFPAPICLSSPPLLSLIIAKLRLSSATDIVSSRDGLSCQWKFNVEIGSRGILISWWQQKIFIKQTGLEQIENI